MITKINEVLVNNAGQRLTTELINGMAHSIRLVVNEFISPDSLTTTVNEGEYIPSSDENISEEGK